MLHSRMVHRDNTLITYIARASKETEAKFRYRVANVTARNEERRTVQLLYARLGRFKCLDLALQPVPQLSAKLVVVSFRLALSKARPWDQELLVVSAHLVALHCRR